MKCTSNRKKKKKNESDLSINNLVLNVERGVMYIFILIY